MKYTLLFIVFLLPVVAFAQENVPITDAYVRAKVLTVSPEEQDTNSDKILRSTRFMLFELWRQHRIQQLPPIA